MTSTTNKNSTNLNIFKSEYTNVSQQISSIADKLKLEVFCNTQGHIEIRNPKYNRVPSSVFYKMLRYKDETGIQVFPQFLEDLFITQISPVFFDQSWARSLPYQYAVTISMQFIGYGLAGLARACLVYPDYCLWPTSLSVIVLNRTLHESSGYSFRLFKIVFTRYRYLVAIFSLTVIWTV